MDVFDFALKKEKEGRDFYLEMAEKTNRPGFKHILTMLADIEERHYQIVKRIRERAPEVPASNILEEAKTVFEKFRDSGECFECSEDEPELYAKARQMEEEARDFYERKEQEATDESQKKVLRQLKEEEHRHYVLLDNILKMLEHPGTWVENAEFTHLEDY